MSDPDRRTATAKAGGPPATPDGRYIVVRGRLWRRARSDLDPQAHATLVQALMAARRAVAAGRRAGDVDGVARARAAVDAAKRALGERGPPWWTDGAPDLNRRMVANTPYAAWFADLGKVERAGLGGRSQLRRRD